jgi:hypothetical protein
MKLVEHNLRNPEEVISAEALQVATFGVRVRSLMQATFLSDMDVRLPRGEWINNCVLSICGHLQQIDMTTQKIFN